jgi:hypothetical protein
MRRLPVVIAGILLAAAASAIAFVTLSPRVALTAYERIQSTAAVLATAGALISAAFVVSAYRQSVRAFYEAYRPQLLIQAESQFEADENTGEPIPITIFRYRNISLYQFNDLTLHAKVEAFGKEVSLDDLFPSHMTMPGTDQRFKKVYPVQLINARGIFINREVVGQPTARLALAYEHTYAGSRHFVVAQQYIWNVLLQLWEIA